VLLTKLGLGLLGLLKGFEQLWPVVFTVLGHYASFGERLQIIGMPVVWLGWGWFGAYGTSTEITNVIVFPAKGIESLKTGEVKHISRIKRFVKPGDITYHSYRFSEPSEMVEGKWVFRLQIGENVLVEKVFHVGFGVDQWGQSN